MLTFVQPQMAADIHVDASEAAVRELARFGTRLVHVADVSGAEAVHTPNVHTTTSLATWVADKWGK